MFLFLQSRLCSSNFVLAPPRSKLFQDPNLAKSKQCYICQTSNPSNLVPAPPISTLLHQFLLCSLNLVSALPISSLLLKSHFVKIHQNPPFSYRPSKILFFQPLALDLHYAAILLIPRSSIPPNSKQSSKIRHWNNYYASVSPLIHFLPHTAFVKILNQVANIAIVFPSSCHKIQPTKLKFR